jgi:subtilisin family serine protease
MSRFLVVVLFAFAALAEAQPRIAADLAERLANGERVRVIVALTEPRAEIEAFEPDELTIHEQWGHVPAFAGEMTIAALSRLARQKNVLAVSVDRGGTIAMNESLPQIGAPAMHARGFTGGGATVAVIDTGITSTHADFSGRISGEQCYCTTNGNKGCCPNGAKTQSGAGAARDDNGHGTFVSGIIASNGTVAPRGVAPSANIVVIRVTDAAGSWAFASQIISALNYIIERHPEVRVVNISLGNNQQIGACDSFSADTMAIASAVNTLRARGTAVFAASGNNAFSNGINLPACISGIISVGAVYDTSGGYLAFGNGVCIDVATRTDQITCFSNSGANLDLLAPGAWITSSSRSGGTAVGTGTSHASPHAAGAAAVLLGIRPSLTADALEALMKRTGTTLVDPRNGIGVPRIDLQKAVEDLIRDAKKRRSAPR